MKTREDASVSTYSASCIWLSCLVQTYFTLILFAIGLALLGGGLIGLSKADINPPEKATPKAPETATRKAPETATRKAPEIATNRAPDIAVNFLPEASFNFLPEAAINRAPDAAINQAPDGATGTDAENTSLIMTNPEEALNLEPENLNGDYDDTLQRNATGNLFRFIEGAFGAIVMTAAGLGAIIAAALGAYKMAWALVAVAVGAFILRAFVSLFFGTDYDAYAVGGADLQAIGG